jgi:hypothetical protein
MHGNQQLQLSEGLWLALQPHTSYCRFIALRFPSLDCLPRLDLLSLIPSAAVVRVAGNTRTVATAYFSKAITSASFVDLWKVVIAVGKTRLH